MAVMVIWTGVVPTTREASPGCRAASACDGSNVGDAGDPDPLLDGTGAGILGLEFVDRMKVTDAVAAVYPVTDAAVACTRHWPVVVNVSTPVEDVTEQSLAP